MRAGYGSCRKFAADFKRKHGTTSTKLIINFKKEPVSDQARSDRIRTASYEGASRRVLSALTRSPKKGIRRLSATAGFSRSSIGGILKTNKWHPYKIAVCLCVKTTR